eukprot:GHVU01032772.1.p2 GENE.GHVU01032772.1~~GHVU01032772.1.p2  ORF type:complete len:107 (+),score=12.58 GHVU01032772.1:427-747(+)
MAKASLLLVLFAVMAAGGEAVWETAYRHQTLEDESAELSFILHDQIFVPDGMTVSDLRKLFQNMDDAECWKDYRLEWKDRPMIAYIMQKKELIMKAELTAYEREVS